MKRPRVEHSRNKAVAESCSNKNKFSAMEEHPEGQRSSSGGSMVGQPEPDRAGPSRV